MQVGAVLAELAQSVGVLGSGETFFRVRTVYIINSYRRSMRFARGRPVYGIQCGLIVAAFRWFPTLVVSPETNPPGKVIEIILRRPEYLADRVDGHARWG